MTKKSTLLFVDDEVRVVNLLRVIFREDYEVLTATSGDDALVLLKNHTVDVIISDQRMPGMVGVEFLKLSREISPNSIRILLTGYSDLAAIVGSINDGEVFRFINKPWDHEEIKVIIADAVAAGQAARGVATAATSVPAYEIARDDAPEVLLIDDNPRDLQAMQQVLVGASQTAQLATSIPEALAVLERHNIGVIVTEARVGNANMTGFLRALKLNYPLITTVMLTSASDAGLVVELINKAQIYRFATKPLRRVVFQLAVSGAMKEHQRFKANPHLVARHRVERSTEPEDDRLIAAVARSLTNLRNKFMRITGAR